VISCAALRPKATDHQRPTKVPPQIAPKTFASPRLSYFPAALASLSLRFSVSLSGPVTPSGFDSDSFVQNPPTADSFYFLTTKPKSVRWSLSPRLPCCRFVFSRFQSLFLSGQFFPPALSFTIGRSPGIRRYHEGVPRGLRRRGQKSIRYLIKILPTPPHVFFSIRKCVTVFYFSPFSFVTSKIYQDNPSQSSTVLFLNPAPHLPDFRPQPRVCRARCAPS